MDAQRQEFEGWLHLAIVLDLFSREVLGWSLKPRMIADNRKRLHSTLGNKSPIQFMNDWISSQQNKKRVA
jgi:transposase InsO family protein